MLTAWHRPPVKSMHADSLIVGYLMLVRKTNLQVKQLIKIKTFDYSNFFRNTSPTHGWNTIYDGISDKSTASGDEVGCEEVNLVRLV